MNSRSDGGTGWKCNIRMLHQDLIAGSEGDECAVTGALKLCGEFPPSLASCVCLCVGCRHSERLSVLMEAQEMLRADNTPWFFVQHSEQKLWGNSVYNPQATGVFPPPPVSAVSLFSKQPVSRVQSLHWFSWNVQSVVQEVTASLCFAGFMGHFVPVAGCHQQPLPCSSSLFLFFFSRFSPRNFLPFPKNFLLSLLTWSKHVGRCS